MNKELIIEYANNNDYSSIFLSVFLLVFVIISFLYYTYNPLNLYYFFGLKTIIITLFIFFFIVSTLVFYRNYYIDNDYFYTSKSLFNVFNIVGEKILYYFMIPLIGFYIFINIFRFFQNDVNNTKLLLDSTIFIFLFFITLFVIYTLKTFFSNKESPKSKGKNVKFTEFLNDLFELTKRLLFYLSCFVSDIYNVIYNEVKKTNVLSLVILITLISIIVLTYILPKIILFIFLYDGKLLLNEPKYLNESNYLINYKNLNKDITNHNVFKYINQGIYSGYEKVFGEREYFSPQTNEYVNNSYENINFSSDKLNDMLDSNGSLESTIDDVSKGGDKSAAFLSDYLKNIAPATYATTIDSIINYLYELYNSNAVIGINKSFENASRPSVTYKYNSDVPFNYNYSISCWIFIDNYDGNNKTDDHDKSIIRFGNKFDTRFNPYKKELSVKVRSCPEDLNNEFIEKKYCKTKIVYKTKEILFQRWNHFVFNYDSGTLDIFVNNRLVSSTPNVSPLFIDDGISVGDNEGVEGAICNVMYFSNILSKTSVNFLYKMFYTLNPPIVKYI